MVLFLAGLFSNNSQLFLIILVFCLFFLRASHYFTLIKIKMTLRSIFPLIILLIFVYVVFVFPFEILATWLGHPGGPLELIISTLVIYLICLFYLRIQNSNKLLKFLVYEGVGVGSISLFIIIPILFIDILFLIPNNIKITIFFFFQIPLLIFGLFNARKIKIKKTVAVWGCFMT